MTLPMEMRVPVVALNSLDAIVRDTDVTLFPGSDSDIRAGNLVNGTSRVIVIGKRSSDTASDGKMYSRALQADSAYTAAVTCRRQRRHFAFRTNTIALGNSAPDPYPFNSNGYGNYAYPSVDYGNTARTYIDPQTEFC